MAKADKSTATVAAKLRVDALVVEGWKANNGSPTIDQLRIIAKLVRRPLAFFFLPDVPRDFTPPVRDYRATTPQSLDPSGNLRAVLEFYGERQEWLRRYAAELGLIPVPWVGRHSNVQNPEELAKLAIEILGTNEQPLLESDAYRALIRWTEHLEAADGFVFNFAVLQQFQLDPKVVSGIALADDIAPFILLNGKGSPKRRIFTLLHEFMHLLLGASGISAYDLSPEEFAQLSQPESLCNSAAALVLLPPKWFIPRWQELEQLDTEDPAAAISRETSVSYGMALLHALKLGLISQSAYEKQKPSEPWEPEPSGGGNYWQLWKKRIGVRFSRLVFSARATGLVNLRDIATLLDVKVSNLGKAAKHIAS